VTRGLAELAATIARENRAMVDALGRLGLACSEDALYTDKRGFWQSVRGLRQRRRGTPAQTPDEFVESEAWDAFDRAEAASRLACAALIDAHASWIDELVTGIVGREPRLVGFRADADMAAITVTSSFDMRAFDPVVFRAALERAIHDAVWRGLVFGMEPPPDSENALEGRPIEDDEPDEDEQAAIEARVFWKKLLERTRYASPSREILETFFFGLAKNRRPDVRREDVRKSLDERWPAARGDDDAERDAFETLYRLWTAPRSGA